MCFLQSDLLPNEISLCSSNTQNNLRSDPFIGSVDVGEIAFRNLAAETFSAMEGESKTCSTTSVSWKLPEISPNFWQSEVRLVEEDTMVLSIAWEATIELAHVSEECMEKRLAGPENAGLTLGSIHNCLSELYFCSVSLSNSPHDTSRIIQRTIWGGYLVTNARAWFQSSKGMLEAGNWGGRKFCPYGRKEPRSEWKSISAVRMKKRRCWSVCSGNLWTNETFLKALGLWQNRLFCKLAKEKTFRNLEQPAACYMYHSLRGPLTTIWPLTEQR